MPQEHLRARDLGIPFDGTPGSDNAITDVSGVLVGHTTLIEGDGDLVVGKGPVRTGGTAILPRGKSEKAARPGDRIVAVGGRTGRAGASRRPNSNGPFGANSRCISRPAAPAIAAETKKASRSGEP